MAFAHVDNRGSFGSKRSRNEASRNDGDWTCPKCANMNFGFRSVCNRSNCAEPRPPVTPSAPITSPYNYPPPYYFGGVGVPPVPIGLTSRYAPLVPLSPMGYNYSVPGSAHGPYNLLAPFPPATFGGMAYGSVPAVNGYGFSISGSPWVGAIPDNSASRKRRGGPDGLSEGDWTCPNCENVNFAFRTTCNMKKCAAPRPNSGWEIFNLVCPMPRNIQGWFPWRQLLQVLSIVRKHFSWKWQHHHFCGQWLERRKRILDIKEDFSLEVWDILVSRASLWANQLKELKGQNTNSGVPEGSWTCSKCDNINFPFREVCNRKGCGNKKPASN